MEWAVPAEARQCELLHIVVDSGAALRWVPLFRPSLMRVSLYSQEGGRMETVMQWLGWAVSAAAWVCELRRYLLYSTCDLR